MTVVSRGHKEEHARALLLQGVTSTPHMHLVEMNSSNIEDTDSVEIPATVLSDNRRELALEYIVGRLSLEAGVTRAGWKSQTQAV